MAYGVRRLTAIGAGMNAFQWDLRYAPATEVRGLHIQTTDDFTEALLGPTVAPGTYAVVLDYGQKTMRQSLHVTLDPRLHPDASALQARLGLATEILVDLYTFFRPPAPYQHLFVLDLLYAAPKSVEVRGCSQQI